MQKKHSLLVGAHISVAGGLDLSIERAQAIGSSAIQIFTKSNRQWYAKPLTDNEISAFKSAWSTSTIHSIVTHATYLINIGSVDKELEKKSVDVLIMELNRSASLGIHYLIVHPGSRGTDDEDQCLERISNNLNIIFTHAPHGTILLETMAGQGTGIGYTFEHLATIIKNSSFKKRLGICFDTCHAFVAGYDFTTEKAYDQMWQHFDKVVGIEKLKVIHLNDSKKELGSRVDRHTHIGKGSIGLKAFELLMNDPRFFDIPKILETPKDNPTDDQENMQTLIGLLNTRTCAILHYTK